MVEHRWGVTVPEIAEANGRSRDTVAKDWVRDPGWPAPIGKRGRYNEYDADEVAAWVADRARDTTAPLFTREPNELITVAEIAAESGLTASTIYADLSRGRLQPKKGDVVLDGVRLWRRGTVADQMRNRRSYAR